MTTDREILEELCPDDPWSSSWEGLDDCCLFCGSGTMEYGTVEGVKYWHEATCAWMKAVTYLGRSHGIHGYLDDRPKPPVKPCAICLGDPDATLDSHLAHLAADYAYNRTRILERRMRGLPDYSLADHLPVIRAPRGGIRYITPGDLLEPPPDGTRTEHFTMGETIAEVTLLGRTAPLRKLIPLKSEDGDVIGEITSVETTDQGIAVGGVVAPHSPLYDFLGSNRPDLPETFTPDDDDIASFPGKDS